MWRRVVNKRTNVCAKRKTTKENPNKTINKEANKGRNRQTNIGKSKQKSKHELYVGTVQVTGNIHAWTYSWSTSRANGNSKIQINVTSHVLHIWTFTVCFQSFREGFSKIERRFRICHRFFEMFRPAYVNTLGRKRRPSTTLHNEREHQ